MVYLIDEIWDYEWKITLLFKYEFMMNFILVEMITYSIFHPGWPPARVVWLQNGQVVDAKYVIRDHVSYNSLEAGASRGDLTSPFICQASNNDIMAPIMKEYTRNVTCE